MSSWIKSLVKASFAGLFVMGLVGCPEEGGIDEAGENIEEATEDAVESVEDTAEEAGDEIEDAVEQ